MSMGDRRHFLTSLGLCAALAALVAFCFLLKDEYANLRIVGWLIIIKSALFAFLFRDEKRLSIILMVQTIVDVNAAFSVCFNPDLYLSVWQEKLYLLPENVITAKALLLFSASLSCGMYVAGPTGKRPQECPRIPRSILIDIILIAFMIYALIFGADRGSVGTYSSNTNPAYEYAIVAFIMLWYGSGSKSKMRIFMYVYAAIYIGQGLLFGDRSSAFPMIIALFLLQTKVRPSLPVMLVLGLGGIVFSNCIDIFRNSGEINEQFFSKLAEAGFYSNTVSYSFYAGTTITLLSEYVGQGFSYFVNLILATFLGNSAVNVNLANIARDSMPALFNRGGGMTSSFCYFYCGYIGCLIGGLCVGALVRKISNRDTVFCILLATVLSCFFIRWYVYYPIALTRTSLLVPAVMYAAYGFLSKAPSDSNPLTRVQLPPGE